MEEGGRGGGGQDSRRSKRKDVDNDKVVFVGNVNFDATEEQLMSIFSQVGAVASLRLKYDRETGKPLGFGFVEFHDAESAASARRNLNNYEVNGRRIRVDVPSQSQPKNQNKAAAAPSTSANIDMVKRPRVDGAGGEQVASVVANMNPADVYHIVQQTKQAVDANPEQARALLISNPQLAYAVLQAQVLLGMAPQLLQAARQRKALLLQQQQFIQAQMMQLQYGVAAAGYSEEALSAAFGGLDEESKSLLIGVLQMSDEQINSLAPSEKAEALSLRQKAQELIGGYQK